MSYPGLSLIGRVAVSSIVELEIETNESPLAETISAKIGGRETSLSLDVPSSHHSIRV